MAEQQQVDVTAYPLAWPAGRKRTPTGDRKSASFGKQETRQWSSGGTYKVRGRLTVAAALKRLRGEASAFTRAGHTWVIDPDLLVVSTNVPVRNDGLPYSAAREPVDPAVAVYFQLRGKPHCVTCDRWDRVADNLAAVAHHLAAIRGIERWGTATVEALFAGFKALPGGDAAPLVTPERMTVERAAWVVATASGMAGGLVMDRNTFDMTYRAGALRRHPDKGGTPALWHEFSTAASVLRQHHGIV